MRRRWFIGLLGIAAVGAVAGVAAYKQRWRKFAAVEPGVLYRSGQLTVTQFRRALETLGIKTVVCLNAEQVEGERAACEEQGVEFRYLPMPADGLGEPEKFAALLDVVRDPERQPVLVHCQAGVARTGAAVALHRIIHQGWTLDRALAELRSFEGRGRLEPALARHIERVAQTLHR